MDQQSTEGYTPDIPPPSDSSPDTPNKRSHDSEDASPVDVKKVKTEPVTPNPQPGPSNDQVFYSIISTLTYFFYFNI